jgi:hypothetical protein
MKRGNMKKFNEDDRNRKLELVKTLLMLGGLLGTLLIIFQATSIIAYLFSLFIIGCLVYYCTVLYKLEGYSFTLYSSAILSSAAFSGLLVFLIFNGLKDNPFVFPVITIYYIIVTTFVFIFLVKQPKREK